MTSNNKQSIQQGEHHLSTTYCRKQKRWASLPNPQVCKENPHLCAQTISNPLCLIAHQAPLFSLKHINMSANIHYRADLPLQQNDKSRKGKRKFGVCENRTHDRPQFVNALLSAKEVYLCTTILNAPTTGAKGESCHWTKTPRSPHIWSFSVSYLGEIR